MVSEEIKKEILDLITKQKKATIKWVASVIQISEDVVKQSAKELKLVIEEDTIMIPSEAKTAVIDTADAKTRLIDEIIGRRTNIGPSLLLESKEVYVRIHSYRVSGDYGDVEGNEGKSYVKGMRETLQQEPIEKLRTFIPLEVYFKYFGFPNISLKISPEKLNEYKTELRKIDEHIKTISVALAKLSIKETKGKIYSVSLLDERQKDVSKDHYDSIQASLQLAYRNEIRDAYYKALDAKKIKSITESAGRYGEIDFITLLYEYGKSWLIRGYSRKASIYLSFVLEHKPDLYNAYFDLAKAYINFQQLDDAKILLDKIAPNQENNPLLHCNLSLIQLMQGNYEDAKNEIDKAYNLDKRNPYINIVQSKYYSKQNMNKEAYDEVKKALEIQSDSLDAKLQLIELHLNSENKDGAIEELEKLTKDNVYYPFQMIQLGKLYMDKNNELKAYEIFEKALKIIPRNLIALKQIGKLQMKNNEFDKIIDTYMKVLEIVENDFQSRYNLGIAFKNKKLNNRAIMMFEKAVDLKPDDIDAWTNLGEIYNKIGNAKKANECQQKIKKLTAKKK